MERVVRAHTRAIEIGDCYTHGRLVPYDRGACAQCRETAALSPEEQRQIEESAPKPWAPAPIGPIGIATQEPWTFAPREVWRVYIDSHNGEYTIGIYSTREEAEAIRAAEAARLPADALNWCDVRVEAHSLTPSSTAPARPARPPEP